MKFWEYESFGFCTLATALLLVVTLCITHAATKGYERDVRMAQAGYEQATVPGYNMPVWVKSGVRINHE